MGELTHRQSQAEVLARYAEETITTTDGNQRYSCTKNKRAKHLFVAAILAGPPASHPAATRTTTLNFQMWRSRLW
jgi:hypothetical protein